MSLLRIKVLLYHDKNLALNNMHLVNITQVVDTLPIIYKKYVVINDIAVNYPELIFIHCSPLSVYIILL